MPGGIFNQTGGTLNAGTFNQQGGTVTGALENRGTFNYYSGIFDGRLLNYGTANLFAGSLPSFTADDGLLHDSATPLDIAAGQTVILNGQGLTNERTMTLAGNLTATQEIIGDSGTAAYFTQTGGTNTVNGALILANHAGSSGTYDLQGGSLWADTITINPGGDFIPDRRDVRVQQLQPGQQRPRVRQSQRRRIRHRHLHPDRRDQHRD